MKNHKKKTALMAALLFVAAMIVLIVAVKLLDPGTKEEPRGTMTEGFGKLKTVTLDGITYREKPAVTTLLLIGVDHSGEGGDDRLHLGYREGGMADFLMIEAIDHTDKKVYQLQIDRDTMADVTILGIFGNETGSRRLQICTAHAFGANENENARYTVRAVENLLNGLEIDGYYAIDFDAVPVLNDALGGVPVNIGFDMTGIHPSWSKGAAVTLHGKEATEFVRARMSVGSGTNEERMVRHKEYITSAIARMKALTSADLSFAGTLSETMRGVAATDLSDSLLANELSSALSYEICPIEYIDGEYVIGDDGYMEFRARDGSTTEWVLKRLYTRVQ